MVTKNQIMKAVSEAWRSAENWSEGRIIIQLKPTNRSLIVSHQLGNSWESMGLNAGESKYRILRSFDCREFEPQYWEGEEEIARNRLSPEDYDDAFLQICDEIDLDLQTRFNLEVGRL